MNSVSRIVAASVLATGALAASPSQATKIPDGALTIAGLFNPTVTFNKSGSSFLATNGATTEFAGKGSFAPANGFNGTMNGMIKFNMTAGATQTQSVTDFLTFTDGDGDIFHFDIDSAHTNSITQTLGPDGKTVISSSGSLFLLGNIWEENNMHALIGDPTASSLTLTFNSTGASDFGASASLSVPPGVADAPPPAVPEPASWAMMVGGFGLMGGMMRANRRSRTALSFS